MKSLVGLFEAKTKLSELCDRVARSSQPVIITRRGKPLVRIVPLEKEEQGSSVWAARTRLLEQDPTLLEENFELPRRELQPPRPLFDDEPSL